MSNAAAQINLSFRGAAACGVGLAIGVGLPGLLPGVALMCVIIFVNDL